jgi:hypothetical protein
MYFDGNSDLDKSRAINQSNWAQARNAAGRTLRSTKLLKQTANALILKIGQTLMLKQVIGFQML